MKNMKCNKHQIQYELFLLFKTNQTNLHIFYWSERAKKVLKNIPILSYRSDLKIILDMKSSTLTCWCQAENLCASLIDLVIKFGIKITTRDIQKHYTKDKDIKIH